MNSGIAYVSFGSGMKKQSANSASIRTLKIIKRAQSCYLYKQPTIECTRRSKRPEGKYLILKIGKLCIIAMIYAPTFKLY